MAQEDTAEVEGKELVTIVVNMVAGPGTGKSTTAAGVFFELKQAGVNCELVGEYAKDLVWGRTTETLGNQIYIFGKQYHRLWRLLDQVDVIVTDCPLFLSMYYGQLQSEAFRALVLETFNGMDNMTFFLNRVKTFNPAGRVQNEEKARQIDSTLLTLLDKYHVDYDICDADRNAPTKIARHVLREIAERKTDVHT